MDIYVTLRCQNTHVLDIVNISAFRNFVNMMKFKR